MPLPRQLLSNKAFLCKFCNPSERFAPGQDLWDKTSWAALPRLFRAAGASREWRVDRFPVACLTKEYKRGKNVNRNEAVIKKKLLVGCHIVNTIFVSWPTVNRGESVDDLLLSHERPSAFLWHLFGSSRAPISSCFQSPSQGFLGLTQSTHYYLF